MSHHCQSKPGGPLKHESRIRFHILGSPFQTRSHVFGSFFDIAGVRFHTLTNCQPNSQVDG